MSYFFNKQTAKKPIADQWISLLFNLVYAGQLIQVHDQILVTEWDQKTTFNHLHAYKSVLCDKPRFLSLTKTKIKQIKL